MMQEQCPEACGLCNSEGGWLTDAPSPAPTDTCVHPVDIRAECPTWRSLGFCTDRNTHLAEYMADQCPLSCGFGGCPTSAPSAMPTPAPIDLPTTSPSSAPTSSAPTTAAPSPSPTTALPTTAAPTQHPTVPLGRLTLVHAPAAVSTYDALWFDITIDFSAELEVGPVELVPKFSLREAFSEARATNGNVLFGTPVPLDGTSGRLVIPMRFDWDLFPLPPGF